MAQGFDPAAATAAYLSALTPEQHARAMAYTQGGHWLLLWSALVTVAAAWVILRSRLLTRVGGADRAARPWRATALVFVVYSLADAALSLPWTIYAGWWREKAYGLTSQPFAGWLGEWGLNLAISLVMMTVLASLLYALVRRAPKTWWLWSGGLTIVAFLFVMAVAPVVIQPLFNAYTPAPPGEARDAIVAMAKANGVPSDKIYVFNGSKQSNRYTANVAGLFGTARVAMSDTMFAKGADLAEVKGVVGHEMGHYVLNHVILSSVARGFLALVAFFLIDRLYPAAARWMGAGDVRPLSDPAGLPVVMSVMTVLVLAGTPLTNAITRTMEAQADQFSLERVNEPDGLSKALVKTIEYRAATPSRLEELLFYDHPSVGARVRRAMDWKAGHPKTAP